MLTYYKLSPDVTAFSTTRHGGFSHDAYGEMNINRYCGDDNHAINKNLEILSNILNVRKEDIIMPHQTHGTKILNITDDFISQPSMVKESMLEGVDALLTKSTDICIGVSTADCIPIIIYDPEHHSAATIHAGWRGTVERIGYKVVNAMKTAFDSHPELLTAVIGPGISIDAFEVGDEVYEKFLSASFNMDEISLYKNKWHIDLPTCNVIQLKEAGLKNGNITNTKICTYKNVENYFSARRLGIKSGRIFTGIILHHLRK